MGQVPFISPMTPNPIPPHERKSYLIPLVLVLMVLFLTALAVLAYNSTQPKKKIAQPITQPVVTPVSEETTEWKTYIDEVHGFSIQYPSNLELDTYQKDRSVSFVHYGPTQRQNTELGDGLSISIFYDQLVSEDSNIAIELPQHTYEGPTPYKEQKVYLDGKQAQKAYTCRYENYCFEEYQISSEKSKFTISVISLGDKKAEYDKIAEEVLSTIKFQ